MELAKMVVKVRRLIEFAKALYSVDVQASYQCRDQINGLSKIVAANQGIMAVKISGRTVMLMVGTPP